MGLGRYILRRLIVGTILIFSVLVLNFIIIHAAPGGPEQMYLNPRLPPAARDQIRESLGLNKPLSGQFLSYVTSVLHGDLGVSYFTGQPVSTAISDKIPSTLLLMVPSMSIAIIIGIFLGIFAARRPFSITDRIITTFSMGGYSMPVFWLGLLFLTFFSLRLGLFPAGGIMTLGAEEPSVLDVLHHMFLPVTTLVIYWLAWFSLFTRASLIEAQMMPFITAARAKGLPARTVFYRHALRNALLPVVTIIGLFAGYILAGAIVTETVFSWPGLGLLLFQSVTRRDYPVLLGLFLVTAIMVVIMNLITDIIYGILDPRITYD
ncbi:MAG: ABC transporter permease [bacterium]